MIVYITDQIISDYREHLMLDEKSAATQEKYVRYIRLLQSFLRESPVTKEELIGFKQKLIDERFAESTVNTAVAAVNSFLKFAELNQFRIKSLKIQRRTFSSAEKELSEKEYRRLLSAAKSNRRLMLILETLCSTGIRVSELKYFTAEAVCAGEVRIRLKGKTREIIIPGKLRKKLLKFCREHEIAEGAVFVSRRGSPVNRSVIWSMMKKLAGKAGVASSKVFPHNLRKLFARCFYSQDRDLARLADVLGHSSINTTRIYIMSTGHEHRRIIEKMNLIL